MNEDADYKARQGDGLARMIHELPADDTQYLNSLETIGNILRGFGETLMDWVNQVNAGTLTPDQAKENVRSDSLLLGDTFLGKTTVYSVTNWNSPEHLGDFLKGALDLDDPPELAPATAFAMFASQLLDITSNVDQQTDEQWQPQVDGLIEYFGNLLIGVELDDEPPAATT